MSTRTCIRSRLSCLHLFLCPYFLLLLTFGFKFRFLTCSQQLQWYGNEIDKGMFMTFFVDIFQNHSLRTLCTRNWKYAVGIFRMFYFLYWNCWNSTSFSFHLICLDCKERTVNDTLVLKRCLHYIFPIHKSMNLNWKFKYLKLFSLRQNWCSVSVFVYHYSHRFIRKDILNLRTHPRFVPHPSKFHICEFFHNKTNKTIVENYLRLRWKNRDKRAKEIRNKTSYCARTMNIK